MAAPSGRTARLLWPRTGFHISKRNVKILHPQETKVLHDVSPEVSPVSSCLESFDWISKYGKGFQVDGSKIRILYHPKDFYQTLLDKVQCSVHRVTLASLYLGSGDKELQLVNHLKQACLRRKGNLRLQVLLDYTRGRRGHPNSCSMLHSLTELKEVKVAAFHTPLLRGWLKKLIPDRWNELIGLQHMKAFIFDDTVIVSGANLSHDYFTNRQDRYIVLHDCKHLADYLDALISTVMMFSMQLKPDGSFAVHSNWSVHPFLDQESAFVEKARDQITQILEGSEKKPATETATTEDTTVYPLVQMAPIAVRQEETFMKALLTSLTDGTHLVMASGYFNLTDTYKRLMLCSSGAAITILMASPMGNGFYRAGGVAGAIPSAYTRFAHHFYQDIKRRQQVHRIRMLEFHVPDWTFHAKGLWYYLPNCTLPCLTTIGSPNYGYRSVERDLELQLIIVTSNHHLQLSLHQEQERLTAQSSPITPITFLKPSRRVPLWVKTVALVFQDFF